jgi:hypothetical protein
VPEWFGDESVVRLGLTYMLSAGAPFGFFATVSHLSEISIASADKVGLQNWAAKGESYVMCDSHDRCVCLSNDGSGAL